MQLGRKEIASTDAALVRAQKVVADTIDVGTKTAATLEGQTKQLERVMDDLDEIHFSMKKASQVIRDVTRGVATDRYFASAGKPMMLSLLETHSGKIYSLQMAAEQIACSFWYHQMLDCSAHHQQSSSFSCNARAMLLKHIVSFCISYTTFPSP